MKAKFILLCIVLSIRLLKNVQTYNMDYAHDNGNNKQHEVNHDDSKETEETPGKRRRKRMRRRQG